MPAARLFDFRDPLPMPAGAARLVAALTDAAPRVGLLLAVACGRTVPVACAGVRRAALLEVASPGALWAPLACGLPDPGLLLVPARTAVALADLYLGGLGDGEDRPCSVLEQQLLVRHTLPALAPLAAALADQGVSGFAAGPLTDDPLPLGGGEVLAIGLDVELPGGESARLTVCLPAKSLLPSDAGPSAAPPSPAAEAALADVPVEVAVRTRASVVSAADVEDLQPGDVIRLDPEAVQQLLGLLPHASAELPVFSAGLGRRDDRRAVLVHTLPSGGS